MSSGCGQRYGNEGLFRVKKKLLKVLAAAPSLYWDTCCVGDVSAKDMAAAVANLVLVVPVRPAGLTLPSS